MNRLNLLLLFTVLCGCGSEQHSGGPSDDDIALNNRGVALMGYFDYGGAADVFEEAVTKQPRWLDARVLLASFESMVQHSAQDVLADVAVPTLVIGGERDDMAPPERSQEMHRAIAGSSCHIYAGCTHLAMLEKPDRVLGDIAAFLSSLPA